MRIFSPNRNDILLWRGSPQQIKCIAGIASEKINLRLAHSLFFHGIFFQLARRVLAYNRLLAIRGNFYCTGLIILNTA